MKGSTVAHDGTDDIRRRPSDARRPSVRSRKVGAIRTCILAWQYAYCAVVKFCQGRYPRTLLLALICIIILLLHTNIYHLLRELLPRGRCALVALLGSALEQLGRSLTVLGDTDALG